MNRLSGIEGRDDRDDNHVATACKYTIVHMRKRYIVELDKKRVGYTLFEDADPPMRGVQGKLILERIDDGYEFFRAYCQHNHITINEDDPEFKFLDTQSMNTLKVFDESGTEIQGVGVCIRGMEDEGSLEK